VAAVGTMFHADCVYSDGGGFITVPTQSDANLQAALLAGVNNARVHPSQVAHLLVIPDDVTVTRVSDGVLLRLTDGTAHGCDNWAPTDTVPRTEVRDFNAIIAHGVADNLVAGHIATGSGIPTGKRVAVINVTDPTLSASTAQRVNTPSGYIASWTASKGVFIHVPLSTAPSTVIDPALVTLIANPPSGSGAPVLTSTSHVTVLEAVFSMYLAIHANTPNPGPQLLNLATLAVDMDIHQTNPLVEESIVTVGRILGWVAGVTAQRCAWDGAVILVGGTFLQEGTVRGIMYTSGAIQTGVDAGWVGAGAPLGRSRNSVTATNLLLDSMMQTAMYDLIFPPPL